CILFGFNNKHDNLPVFYNNYSLTFVPHTKILGVWFDRKLNFNKHISELRKCIAFKLSVIRRAKTMLPLKVKIKLYYAHIHSPLNYCLLVWGNASQSNMNKLFILQKSALRMIYNIPHNGHTGNLFQHANIITIRQLYYFKLGITLKKCNPYFINLFNLHNRHSRYSNRSSEFYNIPFCRLSVSKASLNVTVPKLLNTFHAHNIILFFLTWKNLKTT